MHPKPVSIPSQTKEVIPENGMQPLEATVLALLEGLLPDAAADVEKDGAALCGHFTTLTKFVATLDQPLPIDVTNAIAGIVTHMQFQDRLTQTMESASDIVRACQAFSIEDRGLLPGQMASEIVAGIRLASLRERYLKTLRDFGIMVQPFLAGTADDQGDIEIF